MNIQLLLVHNDSYFVEHFSSYAGGSQHEFSLVCFTDPDKALSYWKDHQSAIRGILAGQDFLDRCGGGSGLRVCLTDFTRRAESREEVQALNIYQQRRDILADLRMLLCAHLGLPQARGEHSGARVICFFSTQGGGGKSTLAYLTALRGAQEGQTAYLTLEPAPCPGRLYAQPQSPVSGEDLLYAVRERQDPSKAILPALVHNGDNVRVLPATHSLQDLMELTAEDWEYLLNAILQYGEMDYVILDLGSELSPVCRMAFDRSDLAVLVYTDDLTGQCKRDRLLKDPGFPAFGLPETRVEARNKCRQKTAPAPGMVPFPVSQSLEKGVGLSTVLSANPEFFNGCAQLLQASRRKE